MAKLKIRNFGPIQTGSSENDGFLEISPVTVICGNQATGKSTIAKLYSIFSWLEKAKKASKSGVFDLPISNVKLIYDKNSLTMKVVTDNNRTISIYSASSGIQSVIPLSIVSKYITEEVSSNFLNNIQKLSANERKQIKEWIKKDTKDEEKNQLLL